MFFTLFIIAAYTKAGAQSFLEVQPGAASAKPVSLTSTNNQTINAYFVTYGVTSYIQTFPGAKNQVSANKYEIHCNGNIDTLKSKLTQTGLFTSILKRPYAQVAGCTTPVTLNDPFFIPSLNYSVAPYHLNMIEAPCAWSITGGDPAVVAAIVDSEFDPLHPDMAGKFVSIYDPEPEMVVNCHHGTKVSCVAAENNNNNIGCAGVGGNIKLAGYRVKMSTCYGSPASRIWRAYLDGRRVINVSFESTGLGTAEAEEITQGGSVLVLAAGNTVSSAGHASIAGIPGVIVVSSVNQENKIGPTTHARHASVDLCAPGVAIPSGTANPPSLGYSEGTGTSNAAPIVTGIVGLMLSVNPCLTPPQIESILKATCDRVADSALYPGLHGAGRVNAYKAVQMAQSYNTLTAITSNTTWSGERLQGGEVRIKPGNTLTITGNIKMMCPSRIVVEKGGRLIIDGGKINSYNINSKWSGIEVAGAKALSPVAPNQGYLEIKNGAVIENAYTGICNYEQGIWEGGGIIKASNCTFYNCRRGVALNDYPNYSYYIGPGNSNCSFDQVTFRIDNMSTLPTGSSYPLFFSSWNTSGGIRITNCTFRVDIPYLTLPVHKRGYGIYSLASGMLVRGCTFNGLMYGFSSAGYDGTPTRTVKVYSNTFEHNADNIMLAGDAFSDVRANTIREMHPWLVNRPATGIYIDQSKGSYIGCDNTISGITTSGPSPTASKIAVIANETRSNSSTIMENNINDIAIGIQTQGNNPNLNTICNDFTQNQIALMINPLSVIADGHLFKNQGTNCTSTGTRAGNRFYACTRGIQSDNLGAVWNYYVYYPDINQRPPLPAGSSVSVNNCSTSGPVADPNSQCNKPLSCIYSVYDVATTSELSSLRSSYTTLVNAGKKAFPEARILFGHIIRGFNDLNDRQGLQSFLVGENDDETRRLLIPLYIEQGAYTTALSTINSLAVSQAEKSAYNSYYNVLIGLRQQNRQINALTQQERATVQAIANADFEVTPYAKGLLEYAYDIAWAHPVDVQNQQSPAAKSAAIVTSEFTSSYLSNASPNPATDRVNFIAWVTDEDYRLGAAFVLKSITGQVLLKRPLRSGENRIQLETTAAALQPGLYIYSLITAHGVVDSKKLSVIK